MNIYRVNWGDNLTKFDAPCILFVRNNNNYYWFDGWNAPGTLLPKEIGKYIEDTVNQMKAKKDCWR